MFFHEDPFKMPLVHQKNIWSFDQEPHVSNIYLSIF
nr:MAG TPA: hypothetical protein [Caudoviricetes sp.]